MEKENRTPEAIGKEILETVKKINILIEESHPYLSITQRIGGRCYQIQDYILDDKPLDIEVFLRCF
jgi:hypothetical protein